MSILNVNKINPVGSGSTITIAGIASVTSSISIASSCTATTFYGSGSNLTGIDATKIITGNTQVQTIDTGSDGHVKISTEGGERLRIGPAGQLGIAGANYGTSGQVLTSQGSGSAIQWATPAAGWVHGVETALNGNVTLIKNGVPDGASHIRYLFRYVSTNSTAQPYVQVEYNNNGTIKNSNYQTCSTTTRNGSPQVQGDSDKTDGLQLWYGYTNAGNILHGVLDIY